ncbi:unnamed protein product [Moneuplotes crassus]|uniref:Uncharacterized protein n=1 Tax=Euplotes crassus TaxID=5936 RepID=A0AAD1Y0Z6_EUPCR|nr:unnamed protein product [Moneuplotes crassus]
MLLWRNVEKPIINLVIQQRLILLLKCYLEHPSNCSVNEQISQKINILQKADNGRICTQAQTRNSFFFFLNGIQKRCLKPNKNKSFQHFCCQRVIERCSNTRIGDQ